MAVNRRQVAVRKRTGLDRFIPVVPSIASFKLHDVAANGGESSSKTEDQVDHWDSMAEALEFRPLNRVLQYSLNSQRQMLSSSGLKGPFHARRTKQKKNKKIRNSVPYRSLDAPGLLNDYYCTLIAWSNVSGHLAVGLGSQVFLWTEYDGSQVLPLPDDYGPVSCLAFSCSNILAVGRKDGSITCYDVNHNCTKSIYVHVDAAVCSAAWLPQSETDLFVGDEIGNVMLLKTDGEDSSMYRGSVLKCHTQQICGGIRPSNIHKSRSVVFLFANSIYSRNSIQPRRFAIGYWWKRQHGYNLGHYGSSSPIATISNDASCRSQRSCILPLDPQLVGHRRWHP